MQAKIIKFHYNPYLHEEVALSINAVLKNLKTLSIIYLKQFGILHLGNISHHRLWSRLGGFRHMQCGSTCKEGMETKVPNHLETRPGGGVSHGLCSLATN